MRGWGQTTLLLGLCCAVLGAAAPAASAAVTIGADVTQMPATSGTCGYSYAPERPCMILSTPAAFPDRQAVSPCDGTITRFRLNGIPTPADHYRLRVVRENEDGSFTGTATSDQVSIATDGVNEYATELPIAKGEYIGVDFQDSTEDHGLRYVGTGSEIEQLVFYAFPADGGSAHPGHEGYSYYLFNADVACAGEGEGGGEESRGVGQPPSPPVSGGPSPETPAAPSAQAPTAGAQVPTDFGTATFDGSVLRIRLACPARFKPDCLGNAVAITAKRCHRRHGRRRCKGGVPMTATVSAKQRHGKWKVVALKVKPKYRKLVAKLAAHPRSRLLTVRQVLHAKGFRHGRHQSVFHRYRVRSG